MKVTKIFGPPGTGKTTKLLGIVENALHSGISPEQIAYLSFSTKAADEAVERATAKFKLPKKNFIYFRTIHSLGYKAAGMRQDEVMQFSDYESIAQLLGVKISTYNPEEDTIYGKEVGDQCKSIHELSRAKMISLKDEWAEASIKLPINYSIVEQWANTVDSYKKRKGMYDFSDMLEHYSGALPVSLFIVDEAQDLSKLQWNVVRQACGSCERMFIAGDDDQCIFNWNGADLQSFLGHNVDEDIVLPQSFRVPKRVLNLAEKITQQIKVRKEKHWQPKDEEGEIKFTSLMTLPIEQGEWMILVRNTKFLDEIEQYLQSRGLLYKRTKGKQPLSIDPDDAMLITGWVKLQKGEMIGRDVANKIAKKINPHARRITAPECSMDSLPISPAEKTKQWYDVFSKGLNPRKVEYIRNCLRHGQKLNEKPRITVSTIHKVKGGEAENVAICPDVTFNTYKCISDDDEQRVWYVGVTRAKKNLYILSPSTRMYYDFGKLI